MVTIANMPLASMAAAKMVNIMAMIQSSLINTAAKSERNWLFALVGWIVISGLVTGLLTILLYKKTGNYNEAVQKEADARIAESNAEAKRAGESAGKANERAGIANEAASKANERSEKLEKDNLTLRKDLETATAESRSKAAELAREQTKLSQAQKETANAQRREAEARKALEETVERRTAPRHLTPEQRITLISFLRDNPKGEVTISSQGDDNDANTFALELGEAIRRGGWNINRSTDIGIQYRPGLMLAVHSADKQGPNDAFLLQGLTAAGWPPQVVIDAKRVKANKLVLIVGPRPK